MPFTSTTPLDEYPQLRKILYTIFWFTALGQGAVGLALAVVYGPDRVPTWYTITNIVLNYAYAYSNYQARQNITFTPYNPKHDVDPDTPQPLPGL